MVFFRGSDNEKSDEELIRLYQADEQLDRVSTLFLRYVTLVYGVCLKYLRNRDEAQDAVMHIHEKLIRDLLKHDVQNFRAWLYVSTRNHCFMLLRSRQHQAKEELPPALMENGLAEHPEEEVMLSQDTEMLEKCLQTLAEAQQRCITLFYFEEKCYKEITALTGFDHNQVKSYIQNGKRNLKICMERNGG
ncbi:MAG: sigma-70 family RNA polymerase sigma factor [Cyclobacteriaceae bacterium]|nr:sigma-70 family RNA polymerase sigma factor [Cyclobacteriaceae bacterium]